MNIRKFCKIVIKKMTKMTVHCEFYYIYRLVLSVSDLSLTYSKPTEDETDRDEANSVMWRLERDCRSVVERKDLEEKLAKPELTALDRARCDKRLEELALGGDVGMAYADAKALVAGQQSALPPGMTIGDLEKFVYGDSIPDKKFHTNRKVDVFDSDTGVWWPATVEGVTSEMITETSQLLLQNIVFEHCSK